MNFQSRMEQEEVSINLTPLIDVVFLLLIFFMVTASLRKEEADLGLTLPGTLQATKKVEVPDEPYPKVNSTEDFKAQWEKIAQDADNS